MPEPLQCEIVTPELRLYSAEANFVVIPGMEGVMGIYHQHSPQVTTLGVGCVKVVATNPDNNAEITTRIAVAGGYAEVTGSKVIVLANRAQLIDDSIDPAEVEESIAQFTDQLASLGDDDPGKLYAKHELEWFELLQRLIKTTE